MGIARFFWAITLLVAVAVGIQALFLYRPSDPEDLPWTELDLRAPIGIFTGKKLGALDHEPARCRALLREAEVGFVSLPANPQGPDCGWSDAVRLRPSHGDPTPIVPLSCPLAAGVDLWIKQVVQPAALDLLGSPIARIETLGSYACRRINGRAQADWSEHASANAIDVSAFRLVNGRRVTVARDWHSGARGVFLHRVRDGACRLFATTLSPDYNLAHHDHLHLDQAHRGALGWRSCS